MSPSSLGVAVIGAGMAGRAHIAGYRAASTLYGPDLPGIRLVAVADAYPGLAEQTAARFGYAARRDRLEGHRRGRRHRRGQHRRRQPSAPRDRRGPARRGQARAVREADGPERRGRRGDDGRRREAAGTQAASGSPSAARPRSTRSASRSNTAPSGEPVHFNGHYWCDYGVDADAPMSWRYKGGPGSGALADIGSHVIDVAEFVCGPITAVRGGVLATAITERALPLGNVVGHAKAALSDTREPVENEDLVTFTATFASGATATLSASRVAYGLPNSLGFELFTANGAATFDLARAGEFGFVDGAPASATQGYRQVLIGPEHPYLQGGLRDGLPQRRLRPERPLRLPGARVPRAGRRASAKLPPVPVVRARPAQPAAAGRRSSSRRSDGGAEVAVPHSTQKDPDVSQARRLHRLPARPSPRRRPGCAQGQRPDLGGGQHRRVHPVAALPHRRTARLASRRARTTWPSSPPAAWS